MIPKNESALAGTIVYLKIVPENQEDGIVGFNVPLDTL